MQRLRRVAGALAPREGPLVALLLLLRLLRLRWGEGSAIGHAEARHGLLGPVLVAVLQQRAVAAGGQVAGVGADAARAVQARVAGGEGRGPVGAHPLAMRRAHGGLGPLAVEVRVAVVLPALVSRGLDEREERAEGRAVAALLAQVGVGRLWGTQHKGGQRKRREGDQNAVRPGECVG